MLLILPAYFVDKKAKQAITNNKPDFRGLSAQHVHKLTTAIFVVATPLLPVYQLIHNPYYYNS
jgi:hypothetical protein